MAGKMVALGMILPLPPYLRSERWRFPFIKIMAVVRKWYFPEGQTNGHIQRLKPSTGDSKRPAFGTLPSRWFSPIQANNENV